MPCLLDTNVLLRSGDPASPHHAAAVAAIRSLGNSGEELRIIPQVIVEFWSAASRPAGPPANGLGLPIAQPVNRPVIMKLLSRHPWMCSPKSASGVARAVPTTQIIPQIPTQAIRSQLRFSMASSSGWTAPL